jgi:hypothetical protein
MSTGPTLAKTAWTQADFDQMSWHDNEVHAIAIEPALPEPGRLLLDIDYIVQWVPPQAPSRLISFWICPATLVFDPAWDLTTDIDLRGWAFSLSLLSVQRSDPDERGNFDWTWPATSSPSNSAPPASPSTCAADPCTAPVTGSPSRSEEDSASTGRPIRCDRGPHGSRSSRPPEPVDYHAREPHAGVAQQAEQPSCKRQASGSNPLTGSRSEGVSAPP